MAEKLEDLNLPNNTMARIIKDALPDHVNVGKDARSALSRAASVFILYVTSQASSEAQKGNRKTLMGQDVISALEELEFEDFVEPLQGMLQEFKDSKLKTKGKESKSKEQNLEETEEHDDVMDEEESGD